MEVFINIIKSTKRARSTTMRILNKGVVELRAPSHAHNETLLSFIALNFHFLAKALTIPQQKIVPTALNTGEDLFIFGKHYLLEMLPAQKTSLMINHEEKVITLKKRGKTISRKNFYQLLSKELELYLKPKVQEFEKAMSLTHRHKVLRTKLVRSLWGSCTRSGALTFNSRLIHYPQQIIDYVIIHELAHLQHHNHAKLFWDLVEQYYPEMKIARQTLKLSTFG